MFPFLILFTKLKMFLWRLARCLMTTADLLQHKNMATSAACRLCGTRDSWRHALIKFSMACIVWALGEEEIVETTCQNESDNAKDRIFQMNSELSHEQLVRMVITLWAIWGARRKAVYKDVFQSPMLTHLYIQSYWNDLQVLKKPHF